MKKKIYDLEQELVNSTIEQEASVNITSEDSNELQYSQTYSVKIPKTENKVLVDVAELRKVKDICKTASNSKFSYAELFLGISTLLLGAFLSAMVSNIQYEFKIVSVFLYTICPALGLGCGVAYFFLRKKEVNDAKHLAERIVDCIDRYDENDEVKD